MIELLVVLIIVGAILYLVNTVAPMPAWLKTVINVIAAVWVLLWILQGFRLIGPLPRFR